MNVDAKLVFKFISAVFIYLLLIFTFNFKTKMNNEYGVLLKNAIGKNISEEKKYVVYECTKERLCGGWADRLKGIMSAYAVSLLTDRYFLIYHDRPCLLSNFFEKNSYFLNQTLSYSQSTKLIHMDNNGYRESLRSKEAFNFTSKYLLIKNNLDWIEPISTNKIYKKKLNDLGYNVTDFRIQFLFKDWYSKMFKLNERLNAKYLKFLKKAKPTPNTKLICAQVRVGGDGDAVFMDKNKTNTYWNYIRNNFIQNLTDFRIFLTTDRNYVELEAINEFGKKYVITNEGPNNHLDKISEFKLNDEKLDRIFLDFHSLQNCQMAIVSESGFGKLGVWNRNNPNEMLAMYSNKRSVSESKKKQQIIVKTSSYDLYIL